MNSEAQSYNEKLMKLLSHIQSKFPGSKLVYTDTYNPLMDTIRHPQRYGFVETTRGCCGTGYMESGWPSCNPLTPVQEDAKKVYLPPETEAVFGKPFSVEKLLRFP
ncbi:GDSL esterase/lipase At2g40250-like [Coffea eugenioides]|uniref:GDSL esterase/lipase At2g40250-like n=1 Tax=Coffea eugenioides TaxID=49369 RepID=UPI000F60905F|nr:GDSL esterase/lipase At2g40250-like [Coffea eugenioides]